MFRCSSYCNRIILLLLYHFATLDLPLLESLGGGCHVVHTPLHATSFWTVLHLTWSVRSTQLIHCHFTFQYGVIEAAKDKRKVIKVLI